MCEKIQGTYFKIIAWYFKIYALCFSSFLLFEKQGLIKSKIKTPARWVPAGIFLLFNLCRELLSLLNLQM